MFTCLIVKQDGFEKYHEIKVGDSFEAQLKILMIRFSRLSIKVLLFVRLNRLNEITLTNEPACISPSF